MATVWRHTVLTPMMHQLLDGSVAFVSLAYSLSKANQSPLFIEKNKHKQLHMDHAKLQENIRMLVREVSDLAGGSAGQSASAVAASAFSIGASGAQNPEAKRKGERDSFLFQFFFSETRI